MTNRTSENEEEQQVEWSIIKSTEDHTLIKMHFDDPNSLASMTDEYSLSITFWGVDFFRSHAGHGVKFGTTINWQIYRQMSEQDKETVDKFDFLFGFKVAIAVLILPICFFGLTLPMWMFLHTM